jgi:N6-L-threonylcarbamoyladenine synthase
VVIVRGFRQYEVVSRTIDDAAGEAFDKSATMIGLNYPGGALLARLGDSIDSSPFKLPLVMKNRPEMSFSGLKTAVRCLVHSCVRSVGCDEYCIRTDYGYLSKELQAQLAHTIQKAIVEALLIKVRNHVRSSGLKRIGLTGGVAANRLLRAEIGMLSGVALYVPDIQHCTDNAAMIAYVASQEQRFGLPNTVAYAVPRVCSRWALEKLC